MKRSISRSAMTACCFLALLALVGSIQASVPEPTAIIDLWPEQPPGEPMQVGAEADMTKPEDRLIAARRIIKLGNVSKPQLHVFLPPSDRSNGSLVVVCPGGGFSILAWDLEGTEVAEWLNAQGVAAAVLKYRVPTRGREPRWLAPVQDAQRSMSIVRGRATDWSVEPSRIGILGFSAGGATAVRVALQKNERLYQPVDKTDAFAYLPDFCVLVYGAGVVSEDESAVLPELTPSADAPPFFLVHAADDPVSAANPVRLFLALREANVPAELHVFDEGGHGYGLRPLEDRPVTQWPQLCEAWMRGLGFLSSGPK